MTEAEWLTSTDPVAMLSSLSEGLPTPGGYDMGHGLRGVGGKVSDRRLRLFACACCRACWGLLTDNVPCPECGQSGKVGMSSHGEDCPDCHGTGRVNRSRQAVEVAELYADGQATENERRQFHDTDSENHLYRAARACCFGNAASAAREVLARLAFAGFSPVAAQAALLRCIVGNPFRPVELPFTQDCRRDASGPRCNIYSGLTQSHARAPTCGGCRRPWRCPWLTPTVVALAKAAYEERVPAAWVCRCGKGQVVAPYRCPDCGVGYDSPPGTLDSQRLAVLADALEEAGLTDEAILRHLRGEEPVPNLYLQYGTRPPVPLSWRPRRGPCVRGCHVIDLILGKE